jgi:hypothetical protein
VGIEICTSWLGFPLVVDLVFTITPMVIAMAWDGLWWGLVLRLWKWASSSFFCSSVKKFKAVNVVPVRLSCCD